MQFVSMRSTGRLFKLVSEKPSDIIVGFPVANFIILNKKLSIFDLVVI